MIQVQHTGAYYSNNNKRSPLMLTVVVSVTAVNMHCMERQY